MDNNENEEIKNESNKKKLDISEILVIIGYVLMIIIIVIAGFIIIKKSVEFIKIYTQKNEAIVTTTSYLASVNYDEDIVGSSYNAFTLGHGQVSEKSYFVAYEVLKDGAKKLVKFEAEKTVIYDNLSPNEKPYVEYVKNGWEEVLEIKLYLPVGAIMEEYDLSID